MRIPSHLTVLGAYGRDYLSADAMQADWDSNLDFIPTSGGPKVNKQDADRFDIGIVGRWGPHLTELVTLRVRQNVETGS